jgi:membrane protease YdiL (CAAX protease family)
MELEIADTYRCINCHAPITQESRFCKHCGSLQLAEPLADTQTRWALMQQTALFFGLLLALCCIFDFADDLQTFNWMLICDGSMAVITGIFFSLNWNENKLLLLWKSFRFSKLCAYCAIAFSAAFVVHYVSTFLNVTLFNKDSSYYLFFLENGHGAWWMIFSIALTPAIVEELAFRGYILQNLLKVIDARQAAYVTSFLFAIIHLSFLSLLWLIPLALLKAYVRINERTIWYGVAMHFCFNLTACLFELF